MESEEILKRLSRRKFLRNSVLAATGAALLPSFLSGCHKDEIPLIQGQGFTEGVASFDPSQNRIIFWTRYTLANGEQSAPTVILDVAKDKDFNNLVVSQSVLVDSNSDNTVFVDVSGL